MNRIFISSLSLLFVFISLANAETYVCPWPCPDDSSETCMEKYSRVNGEQFKIGDNGVLFDSNENSESLLLSYSSLVNGLGFVTASIFINKETGEGIEAASRQLEFDRRRAKCMV